MDKSVYKLDTFTITGAYVSIFINEKMFPLSQFWQCNEDIDSFVGYVSNQIGVYRNRPGEI